MGLVVWTDSLLPELLGLFSEPLSGFPQAAQQAGLLIGPSGLRDFLVSNLENVGALLLPFVYAGYKVRMPITSQTKVDNLRKESVAS
jgi:hypothetical protein